MISKELMEKLNCPDLLYWSEDHISDLQEILGFPAEQRQQLIQLLEAQGPIKYGDGPHGDPLLERGILRFNGHLAIQLHNALRSFTHPIPNAGFSSNLSNQGLMLLDILKAYQSSSS